MRLVTLHAEFDDIPAAHHVRQQLVERDYDVSLVAMPSGVQVLSVRTATFLTAEVEGLVWLAGGNMADAHRARPTSRRALARRSA